MEQISKEEEVEAKIQIYKYIFGFTAENTVGYAQTPLSRMLTTRGDTSMASMHLSFNSPTMVEAWNNLSGKVKAINGNNNISPFEIAHGMDIWSYAEANPKLNTLVHEGLACNAKVITLPSIIESCVDVFNGIGTLVDVGGGNGTSLSILVKACPWIKGINFDLPYVVSTSPKFKGVQHVGGNMFDYVPKADAAFFMWVLHNWDDENCIKILKNCKKAIPENRGKVIIIDIVIDEKEENKIISDLRLRLDMLMMAQTQNGKDRTAEEWLHMLNQAGFTQITITPLIGSVSSIIQAFL